MCMCVCVHVSMNFYGVAIVLWHVICIHGCNWYLLMFFISFLCTVIIILYCTLAVLNLSYILLH